MSAFGNMAQSMAQSVQPATATAPGLSKWFAAASAVQALSQVGQGFAGMQSANAEAGALEQQANITMQQAQYDAQQKRRSVLQEAADQSEQYANSGVTLEGTPSRILEDTRRQGQQEVNQIQKRGQYSAQLLRTQALRQKQAGRLSLFGGIANASMGALDNYIKGAGTFGKLNNTVVGKATPLPPTYNFNPGF
jgi:hypothetical protein